MPTFIHSHSNSLHAQHHIFIGGIKAGDVGESDVNVDEDSGDEFYKKIIDDKFEELYGKINSSQVIGNPLYNHVKIIQ